MKKILSLIALVTCFACQKTPEQITKSTDYEKYISQRAENPKINFAKNEIDFWTSKLQKAPNQYPYILKIAAAHSGLFELSSQIAHLNTAINLYKKAIEITDGKVSSMHRSLAKNYISHHMFREAKKSLLKADSLGEGKLATQKMLFDVNMELGDYVAAETALKNISREQDFDYLIRHAKWLDHQGNLDQAISNLEFAAVKAEAAANEQLKLWIYSNLADFYGHAGQLQKSYQYYLRTLAIDPHYSYALKGIAYLAFSHEKNTAEALRIVDAITRSHPAPDYLLFKAEIAAFQGKFKEAEKFKKSFITTVSQSAYGDMYNAYLVDLVPNKALALAKKEVENRPTAQSYALLAEANLLSGNKTQALEIVQKHIINKTFEPKSLLVAYQVFKANGLHTLSDKISSELSESGFELGPVLYASLKKSTSKPNKI
jgi:tetratricopeptide (TPR) repeat protein